MMEESYNEALQTLNDYKKKIDLATDEFGLYNFSYKT